MLLDRANGRNETVGIHDPQSEHLSGLRELATGPGSLSRSFVSFSFVLPFSSILRIYYATATATPSTTAQTNPAAPPATMQPKATCGKSYIVKSGDYCYSIAQSRSITLPEFIMQNSGIDCKRIQPGQEVCVAGGVGGGGSTSVTSGGGWVKVVQTSGGSSTTPRSEFSLSFSFSIFTSRSRCSITDHLFAQNRLVFVLPSLQRSGIAVAATIVGSSFSLCSRVVKIESFRAD